MIYATKCFQDLSVLLLCLECISLFEDPRVLEVDAKSSPLLVKPASHLESALDAQPMNQRKYGTSHIPTVVNHMGSEGSRTFGEPGVIRRPNRTRVFLDM